MTFAEENRVIREKQSIKMSSMTLEERNEYVKKGARQMQMQIEEIRKKAAAAQP